MPDGNEVTVQTLDVSDLSPTSRLIWEVSQQPVLYNTQNPLYKDNPARLTAWLYISKKMDMPVADCQIKWGTLRRCLANARKRQMKRQAHGSKFIKKWRYQDEMSFLLPFIDQRDYDYVGLSSSRKISPGKTLFEYDSSDCADPLGETRELFISEEYEHCEGNDDITYIDIKPRCERLQVEIADDGESQQTSLIASGGMYIEEDEIENIPVEPDVQSGVSLWRRSGQTRDLPGEAVLDEMDAFFLSMSKALKKLPRVEQIHVRSQVYNLVTRAEISWLQKSPKEATFAVK